MKQSKVIHIAYSAGKGQETTFTKQANLIQNKGLAEDYHSQIGDDGLIVVTSAPLVEWMKNVGVEGLCFKRFRYNICLSESVANFKSGDILSIGQAEIEFSTRHKPCFAKKQFCQLNGKNCMLQAEMKFAEIQQSGLISIDDEVTLRI